MESALQAFDELRRFMATRWYVAGRAELLAAGFAATRIRSWIRQGRLIGVLHGVYAYGRDIDTTEGAWRAALVAAGPGAVLAGRSACEAWGIIKRRDPFPRLIEVARRSGNSVSFRGLSPAMRRVTIKVTRRDFEPGEVRRKDGFALTSPVRSLIDFAADATSVEVKFAFLEACRLRLFGRRDVEYCFKRIAGRRGATKLYPLLVLWVPELARIRSVLEGLFLLAWVESGRAVPKVNWKVHGFEVDFYWPEHGVVLEVDGKAFHSDPLARRRDDARTRALEARGLRVIRVSYREMMDDPAGVVARVAAMLGE